MTKTKTSKNPSKASHSKISAKSSTSSGSKKTKASRETLFYAVVFFVLVLAGLLTFNYLFNQPPFAYSFEYEGTLFGSNESEPLSLVKQLANENNSFIIAVNFHDKPSSYNEIIANYSLIPLISVLSFNQKNLLVIAKVYDEKEFTGCASLADDEQQVELAKEDCTALIEDKSVQFAVIEVVFPAELKKPMIEVKENKIILTPRKNRNLTTGVSREEVEETTFNLLEIMFSKDNAALAVSSVNDLTQNITQGFSR